VGVLRTNNGPIRSAPAAAMIDFFIFLTTSCRQGRHFRRNVFGARIMATMVNALEQRGGRYALQTMCEGGGMANATIIERLD